jgi:endonuclease YncB( thermonuclease family)
MFGRRKRQDGFEWHKYIRTTIKVRREQRRQRIEEARRAAAEQAGAAGAALAAGSRAAGAAARDGARAGFGAAVLLAIAAWNIVATAAVLGARRLAVMARPAVDALARPNIGGPVAFAGAIALGSGIGRYRGTGLDGEALVTLGIGVALLVAALPLASSLTGIRMPSLAGLGIGPRAGLIGVAIAAGVGGLAWVAGGTSSPVAGVGSRLPLVGGKPLQGRAEALAGDLVRVGATTVRLAGVEAPERQQTCGAASRRYRCGAAAKSALGRLVNGRSLSCSLGGTDDSGYALATCSRGDTVVNAELVRNGHVFAASGLFSSYAGQEREARAAKAGIWAEGEAERPAAFRAKVWEEAKRRAPEGCPIKGLVTGRERVYVLPWAPDYERGRIQKARGERWFCSEQEAKAAGFRPAANG